MRPEARAQSLNPPVKQWQVAYDYTTTHQLCSTAYSADWSYNITPTRDGGYISAGYSRIKSGTCPNVLTSPTLTKYNSMGEVEWHRVYQNSTQSGISETQQGALREVVELAEGGGYVAAGYKRHTIGGQLVQQIYVVLVNTLGQSPTEHFYSLSGDRAARAYSIREVLSYNINGSLKSEGFIIGGNALDSAGTTGVRRMCMLRLNASLGVTWGRTFQHASPSTGGLTAGVARPLYSGGTIHLPTRALVTERPDPSGATLLGFALVGNGIRSSDQASYDYYAAIVEAAASEANDSLTVAARTALGTFDEFDVYVTRTTTAGKLGTVNFPGTWEYWAADQTDNIRHCSTAGESFTDLGMDLEQRTGDDDLIVSALFNAAGGCTGWLPFFNEGDAELIGFDPDSNTPTISPTQIHHFSGIEWFPNVVPTPDGGYAVVGSTKENLTALNKAQGYLWKGNSSLTPQWEKFYYGPGDDACMFGLALTTDGGYVVSGNNDATTTRNQDEIVVKFSNDCQVNYAYDLNTSSGDTTLYIHGNVVWDYSTVPSGLKTVRGTIRIRPGGTLTIDGIEVQFADTRQTVEIGSITASNPSRIVVERGRISSTSGNVVSAGGRLLVTGGATLNSLQGDCNEGNMWDGVVVEGYPTRPQTDGSQAEFNMQDATDGAYIHNARLGTSLARTTYSPSNNLVGSLTDRGGGVIRANHTEWRNCHTGVYMGPCRYGNKSSFDYCTIAADAPLTDPSYVDADGDRYGMQYGVQMRGIHNVGFDHCTFDGYLPPTADYYERGYGFYVNDGSPGIDHSTFTDLYRGILLENHGEGGSLALSNSHFTNNFSGVIVASSHNDLIRDNIFEVGTTMNPTGGSAIASQFSYGMYYYNSYLSKPENNTFKRYGSAGANNRGLIVAQASPDMTHPRGALEVYRNHFQTGLSTALYAQFANPNVTARCNDFTGTISRANLEVVAASTSSGDGINPTQGGCDRQNMPANNDFTNSCGTSLPKDILLNSFAGGFTYSYDASTYAPACYSSGVSLNLCLIGVPGNCQPSPTNRDRSAIRTELDTTTNTATRQLLIGELIRSYLTDTTLTGGLDSAVVVLQTENDPALQEYKAQLETRVGQTYSSRVAGPNRGAGVARRAGAVRQTTESQSTAPNYQLRVMELLVPLGSDSASAAAIATDADLRAELVQMADDSLTWGSIAARAALNYYAGTHYREWTLDEQPLDAERGTAKALASENARPEAAAAQLRLVPNPTDGPVTVQYRLPAGARQARLVVYNSWGTEVARYALEGETATLRLPTRAGLYVCALWADGAIVAKEQVLVQP